MSFEYDTLDQLHDLLKSRSLYGQGDWIDLSGMIAPKAAVKDLLDSIENGSVDDVLMLGKLFSDIHDEYYEYEWRWAYDMIESYYATDLSTISIDGLKSLINRWKDSVIGLDNMIYDDARKEFSLSSMTSFGADGGTSEQELDFMNVRGAMFESDPFVTSVKEHIKIKSALCDEVLTKLSKIQ